MTSTWTVFGSIDKEFGTDCVHGKNRCCRHVSLLGPLSVTMSSRRCYPTTALLKTLLSTTAAVLETLLSPYVQQWSKFAAREHSDGRYKCKDPGLLLNDLISLPCFESWSAIVRGCLHSSVVIFLVSHTLYINLVCIYIWYFSIAETVSQWGVS